MSDMMLKKIIRSRWRRAETNRLALILAQFGNEPSTDGRRFIFPIESKGKRLKLPLLTMGLARWVG
jgi:hypothetical protein